MQGENAVDAVLAMHAELVPHLEQQHENMKEFENEVTVCGAAACAIRDLVRTVKDFQKEVKRLEGIAWQCWKGDTMTKQEAEVLIGAPSNPWHEAAEAAEG